MTAVSDGAPGPLIHWGPKQMPCLPILKAGPGADDMGSKSNVRMTF